MVLFLLQLPLINSKLNGLLSVFVSNLGFLISFVVLLVVAIYEEKFDTLLRAHHI